MTSAELNMALIDLKIAANRELASQNMESYLDRYKLTDEERRAIVGQDWVAMWRRGASPYALNKLRHMRLLSHDDLAPFWRNCSADEWASYRSEQTAKNASYTLTAEETPWQP